MMKGIEDVSFSYFSDTFILAYQKFRGYVRKNQHCTRMGKIDKHVCFEPSYIYICVCVMYIYMCLIHIIYKYNIYIYI